MTVILTHSGLAKHRLYIKIDSDASITCNIRKIIIIDLQFNQLRLIRKISFYLLALVFPSIKLTKTHTCFYFLQVFE